MSYSAVTSTATAISNLFVSAAEYTSAATAAGDNEVFFGRGNYSNGSFTWSATGTDTIVVYDQNSLAGAAEIDGQVLVLVGVAVTEGVALSFAGGGVTITI
jgi:hypothetical protein